VRRAPVLTRDRVRALDDEAVRRYGIPSMVLMENAAIGALAAARSMLRGVRSPRVVVCAGPGKNGGDGFALARHLHNDGALVRIVTALSPGRCVGDGALQRDIVRRMGLSVGAWRAGLRLRPADLMVDALLGTGLSRPAAGPFAALIDAMNASGVPILALDLPSGLDADSGPLPEAAVVRAARTVTFAAFKPGLLLRASRPFTGRVSVAGIGAPRELIEASSRGRGGAG